MELIGKILAGRYEIIQVVGKGGMATVYKARDNLLNRYVAVKVLKDEYSKDEVFVKRFRTEAQSAASHPWRGSCSRHTSASARPPDPRGSRCRCRR